MSRYCRSHPGTEVIVSRVYDITITSYIILSEIGWIIWIQAHAGHSSLNIRRPLPCCPALQQAYHLASKYGVHVSRPKMEGCHHVRLNRTSGYQILLQNRAKLPMAGHFTWCLWLAIWNHPISVGSFFAVVSSDAQKGDFKPGYDGNIWLIS